MISINTNIGSITAQANMNKVQDQFNNAMTQLSSGLRINSAKDDAAGLAIGEQMTSQIQGLGQAINNANQGKNLVDTTGGAQQEISNMLQRMRELSVQSASDTNTAADRQALSSEANQLITEINRIAQTTTWNGMNVLDGSFTNKQLQIGADQGQTVSISVDSASATAIGENSLKTVGAANLTGGTTGIAGSTTVAISGYVGSDTVTTSAGESAKQLAAAVNATTAKTGVSATASTVANLTLGAAASDSVTFDLNGVTLNSVQASYSGGAYDYSNLKNAINAVSAQTGVTASISGSGSSAKLQLTDATGANISITNFSDTANSAAGTMDIGPADGLTTAATLTSGGTNGGTVTGQVTYESTHAFSVSDTTGASTADFQTIDTSSGTATATASASSSLTSVSQIDLTTAQGASNAISVIDMALQKINQSRSDLGAISNRLDSTISNLTNISTNVQAAKSIVMDANFASESTKLARSQVLSQAATAMLAQANSSQRNVLSLLK